MIKVPSLRDFKLEARALKKAHGIKSTHAHEILAKSYGFKSYNGYLSTQKDLSL